MGQRSPSRNDSRSPKRRKEKDGRCGPRSSAAGGSTAVWMCSSELPQVPGCGTHVDACRPTLLLRGPPAPCPLPFACSDDSREKSRGRSSSPSSSSGRSRSRCGVERRRELAAVAAALRG